MLPNFHSSKLNCLACRGTTLHSQLYLGYIAYSDAYPFEQTHLNPHINKKKETDWRDIIITKPSKMTNFLHFLCKKDPVNNQKTKRKVTIIQNIAYSKHAIMNTTPAQNSTLETNKTITQVKKIQIHSIKCTTTWKYQRFKKTFSI